MEKRKETAKATDKVAKLKKLHVEEIVISRFLS